MGPINLNIGCGSDYREGYINIDGSIALLKVDKQMDLNRESLLEHFEKNSIDFILANDIIEHFFHWEAVKMLKEFYAILKPTGKCEIRVPDTEYIIKSWRLPFAQKINLLYGGQDFPQGDNKEMNKSRKIKPQYFCHKYGWTRKTMEQELNGIGFSEIKTQSAGVNFIVFAEKPSK
jgi:predicted SAM-dependent methyltransferase